MKLIIITQNNTKKQLLYRKKKSEFRKKNYSLTIIVWEKYKWK